MRSLKTAFITSTLTAALLIPNAAYAKEATQLHVEFNQVNIKVNDKDFIGNNILYDGTTYVPIRDVAAMLGLAVNYYDKTETAYIGQIGAGEFAADNHDIDSWDVMTPATPSNAPVREKSDATINVYMNQVTVKVHGMQLKANTFLYEGTTFVPIRAASESIDVPVKYDEATGTAYIGKTSHTFPTVVEQPKAQPKSGMYAVPAEGDMAGWQLLKGHPYEGKANIYFMTKGSVQQVKMEPILQEDLDQVVQWVDSNGNKRTNTVGQLYELFAGLSNQYTTEILVNTFGDLYINWFASSTIDAFSVVDQYLKETGQIPDPTSNVTLKPDSKIVPVEQDNLNKGAGVGTFFHAVDKFGTYKGQYQDKDDPYYTARIIDGRLVVPPLLSEGWIGLDVLAKIYNADVAVENQDIIFKAKPSAGKQQEYFHLTLPSDWGTKDGSTTKDGIKIKNFTYGLTDEWVDADGLEAAGVYVINYPNSDPATGELQSVHRFYTEDKSHKRTTLYEIVLPNATYKENETYTLSGIRLKRTSGNNYSYNTADLISHNIIGSQTKVRPYFNIQDLKKAGILKEYTPK
ncbi:copper amine oxidase N-terminal domain-containing protein [Gorillibacterium sp. sgz5001074]|uniref:copper amine oxidase N-terminal domain-containing protein n=1 Tax=Gorillibacterium sp. sgz5001074 TaxID=3446695 RepID=UPI003F67088B